jgi:hypothetical protein
MNKITERNKEIYQAIERKEGLSSVCKKYGLSKARIIEIHSSYGRNKKYVKTFKKTPTRVRNALLRNDIQSLEKAKQLGVKELSKLRNIGIVTAYEIVYGEYE